LENEQELSSLEPDVAVLVRRWNAKTPHLEALRRQHIAVAVPVQHPDAVRTPREEHEQLARQGVLRELGANQRRQAVDALAAVHALGRQKYPRARRQRQHVPSGLASAATRRATTAASRSSRTRSTTPPRSISIWCARPMA